MRQIRRNVFETNSSSTHSITMCMKSEFDKWVAGELVWDRWGDRLVPITPEVKASMDDGDYLTYDQFNDWDYLEYDTFEDSYTTPNGEEVISFGYYGYNG